MPNKITLESMPESLLRKTGFWQILMLENARINANALFEPEECFKSLGICKRLTLFIQLFRNCIISTKIRQIVKKHKSKQSVKSVFLKCFLNKGYIYFILFRLFFNKIDFHILTLETMGCIWTQSITHP